MSSRSSNNTFDGNKQTSGGNGGLSHLTNIENQQRARGGKERSKYIVDYDDDGYQLDEFGYRLDDEKQGGRAGVFKHHDDDEDDAYIERAGTVSKMVLEDAEDEGMIGGLDGDDLSVVADAGGNSSSKSKGKGKGEVKGDGEGKATKKRKGTGELKNDDDYNTAAEKLKPKRKNKHNLRKNEKTYDIGGDKRVGCENAGTINSQGKNANKSLAAKQNVVKGRNNAQIRGKVMRKKGKAFGQQIGKQARENSGCRHHDTLIVDDEEYSDVLEITEFETVSNNMGAIMKWGERNKKSEKQKEKEAKSGNKQRKTSHAKRLHSMLGEHQFEQIGTDPRNGYNQPRVNGQKYYYIHKDGLFNANDKKILKKIERAPRKKTT